MFLIIYFYDFETSENEFLLVLIIRVTIPGGDSYPYSIDMTGFRHKKVAFSSILLYRFRCLIKNVNRKEKKQLFYGISLYKTELFCCVITWKSILRKNKEIKYFKNLLNDILGKIKWIW